MDNSEETTVALALEELELKYTSLPDHVEPGIQFLSSSPPKGQCLRRLKRIILSENQITSLGDLKQVSETLRNTREIDLSHNDFHSYRIIGDMLRAVPMLKHLDLSFNPLEGQIDVDWIPDNHLEALMLNGVGPSMNEINVLLKRLNKLSTLGISGAALESTAGSEMANKENLDDNILHDSLTELHMDGCQLTSWSDCLQLARRFPALQTLRLCENEFDEIHSRCPQTNVHIADQLPNLRSLSLNSCSINDWKSIEALAELPNLIDLRIRDVPLFDEYDCDTKHQLIVPRLRNLQTLNGSLITTRFREDCERFFIRYYQGCDQKPKIYDSLVNIHGHLERLIELDFTPKEFLRARVRCDEKNLNRILRFRLQITIQQLIRALAKFTGIPFNQIRVLHITPQFPDHGPNELRPSLQFLHTLRIEDFEEFHVLSKAV
ncbi:Leucine Rich repeat-containing domain protein [Aphelenchoides besseyi]|nr:Leucine Rich repeat-containing domain protein [Aphelenchoides besseyi]KAI6217787.1 Leucine Rich repeat-containing domain protein [Aphelenchoides besseyi]